MDTAPQNNDSLEQRQQEVALPGVVSSRARTYSGGERLLPYLFAAMETCWVDAILIGLVGTDSSSSSSFFLPLWVPFVLIASSCWLSNALERRRTTVPHSATSFPTSFLVVGLVCGTTLFSLWSGVYASSIAFFNPTWLGSLISDLFLLGSQAFHLALIIALMLYFYWRGLRLSHRTLEPGNVFTVIRLGIGVMIAVIVLRAATHTTSSNELLLLLLIPLFLMFALIAHALAQTVFVRITHRSGLQGSVPSQERALLGIITAFGMILLVTSLLVGAVANPAFLTDAQRIFVPIVFVYDELANIIAFVLTLLITPIIWLLNLFHFRFHEPNRQAQNLQVICKKYPHSLQCLKNLPPQDTSNGVLLFSIKLLLPIVIMLLLVLIIRLLMRRWSVKSVNRVEEVHESLWSWTLFVTQVKALLRALWLRLFPQQSAATQGQDGAYEVSSEPMARSIREIYRAMLRWAAEHGYPRKRDETPYEFRTRLHARLPLTEPELSTVTEAYTAIRYGSVVLSEADVAHIQQTWQQLQQKAFDAQHEPR